jgi:hypothetical protein
MSWRFGSFEGKTLPYGGGALTLIRVNGERLVELVRRIESPSAIAADEGPMAGKYRPLWGYRFDPGLFVGEPADRELRHPDGVVLIGCDCGVVGCWPLVCRVQVNAGSIVWDAFRQPFRRKWDHSGLGPFALERAAYEDEVARAGDRFRELVADAPDQRKNYERRIEVLRRRHPEQAARGWLDWSAVSGAEE